MTVDVRLPQWGMTMQEATVAEWVASVGDEVAEGQVLVRVETEKVTDSVQAPATGVLVEIVAREGQIVGVGEVLARVEPVERSS